jgi:hypothetical protein
MKKDHLWRSPMSTAMDNLQTAKIYTRLAKPPFKPMQCQESIAVKGPRRAQKSVSTKIRDGLQWRPSERADEMELSMLMEAL